MPNSKRARGSTGMTTANRLRELRTQQNLTYAAVSARLDQLGHPTMPLAIRRMEEGDRVIDVDDLMALATVLGVAPVTLLLPDTQTPMETVKVTGADHEMHALEAHVWARGIGVYGGVERRQFAAWANPDWLNMLAYSDVRDGGRIEFVTRGFDTTYLEHDGEDDD